MSSYFDRLAEVLPEIEGVRPEYVQQDDGYFYAPYIPDFSTMKIPEELMNKEPITVIKPRHDPMQIILNATSGIHPTIKINYNNVIC